MDRRAPPTAAGVAPPRRTPGDIVPGSVALDTALGLAFVFLTVSLVASAYIEWLGNKLNKRGEYLLRGLREMLDIPPSTPSDARGEGSVRGERQGLGARRGRRKRLQDLSVAGGDLRARLAAGPEPDRAQPPAQSTDAETPAAARTPAAVAMPAPLADLVLAHPIIAALHRPVRPGRPFALLPAVLRPPHGSAVRVQARAMGSRARQAVNQGSWQGQRMNLASYVSAQAFARSLIDLLVPDGAGNTTVDELARNVSRLPVDLPARDALLAFLRDAGTSVEHFRRSVESWYDEQMGRVSGWYKRWAQWRLFLVGAAIAVLVNIDTVAVGQALYQDAPVRQAVVAQAVSAQGCPAAAGQERTDCLDAQKSVLRGLGLPVGWNLDRAAADCRARNAGRPCLPRLDHVLGYWWHSATRHGIAGMLLKLFGWLLTAAAVSFGAPFWFDALSKLGSLRTAGRRPGENATFDADRGGR
jgi:hypothetical protein